MTRLRAQKGGGDARRASVVACLAALASAGALACKKPPPPPSPTPHASLSDAGTTALRASPTPAASASHAPPSEPKPPVREAPALTAEAILELARKHVTEAVERAGSKESCAEILPLLDGSYALVRRDVPIEERTLATLARCAEHGQRWRLLRDLAEEIAAGERKLETTYFLPRALVGQGEYDQAHALSKATLRAWPTEGEAYDTAALAALRVKDWDGAMKAADQAILLQRKHGRNDEVTALAHGLRGAAILHMGKIEEGLRELEAAKGHEEDLRVTGVTLEAARAAKQSGLLVMADVPRRAYPGLLPLYVKKVAPLSGLVSVVLQNLGDHPIQATVEVALAGAETASESVSVVKGRPVTVVMTPAWKPGTPLAAPKSAEEHEVTVTVNGADHATILHETAKVTFEPEDAMPKVVRVHAEDLRSAFALEAAWVTPTAPAIAAVVDAAKGRLHAPAKAFEGAAGKSLPQVQAIWDELRSRGLSFRREPALDSEATESERCRLPSEILAAGHGNALESSVLFASLLEAIGLDVMLVRAPGHRMVAWLATRADAGGGEGAPSTVKSPRGPAFFLETTTIGDGPVDAAVLRGNAEWLARTNDGSSGSGRAQVENVAELRHKGIAARTE